MLVATIEMSDYFIGVVSMILLMLPAARTGREAAKNDLKKRLVTSPQTLKNSKPAPNFCQLLFFEQS